MSVLDIVDLTIVVANSALSRPNFGTPLALISKVPAGWGVNMVREFAKLSELVDLGFTTTSAAYKLASAIKSQKPCPKTFKLAKRIVAPSQSLELSVTDYAEGDYYSIEVGVDGGALTEVTYTVGAGATAASVATAIEALIEAVTGVSSTNSSGAAVAATLTVPGVGPGTDGDVAYAAVTAGTAGNSVTVRHLVAGTNTALTVGVVGSAITVNLATNGGGTATSTSAAVVAAIVASGAASALVTATAFGDEPVEADDLAAAIVATNLAGGIAAGTPTATITITPTTATTLVNLKSWSSNFTLFDATPDPGVAADCAAALLADDAWYGLLLDSNSEAESKAGAAWALANGKLFGHSTSDYGVKNSGTTTDVSSDIKLTSNSQAWGIFDADELLGYSAAAFMARGLAFAPGKATWAFKDLPGATTDSLQPGTQNTLETKYCNFYVTRWGRPITYPGKLYNGEFIDVTHFLNWLDAEMQVQVFNCLTKLPKQPYTNTGLAALEATIKAVLEMGVRMGGLVAGSCTVTMPKLDDIDSTTRAGRLVPEIEFDGILAGAIHKAALNGLIRNG